MGTTLRDVRRWVKVKIKPTSDTMYEAGVNRYPVERDRKVLQLRDCDRGKVDREALRDVRDRQALYAGQNDRPQACLFTEGGRETNSEKKGFRSHAQHLPTKRKEESH